MKIKILLSREDSSSKKDDGKRQDELLSFILDDLCRVVNPSLKFFLTDPLYSHLLLDLISLLNAKGNHDKLEEILKNVLGVLEIDYKNNFDDLNTVLLADKTSHFIVNRIIKTLETSLVEHKYQLHFVKEISRILLNNFEGFLDTKAIFIMGKIIENPATKTFLEKEIKIHQKTIKAKSTEKDSAGFKILNNFLTK